MHSFKAPAFYFSVFNKTELATLNPVNYYIPIHEKTFVTFGAKVILLE